MAARTVRRTNLLGKFFKKTHATPLPSIHRAQASLKKTGLNQAARVVSPLQQTAFENGIARSLSFPHVKPMDEKANEQHARDRYIETFGIIAARSGLPAIAGKIAALLYLSPEALSFSEVRLALGVSSGSISTNTRLLEDIGTIIRIVPKGGREHFFQSAPEANIRTIERDIARYEAGLAEIAAANADIRSNVEDLPPIVSAKMDGIEHLFRGMSYYARKHLKSIDNK